MGKILDELNELVGVVAVVATLIAVFAVWSMSGFVASFAAAVVGLWFIGAIMTHQPDETDKSKN